MTDDDQPRIPVPARLPISLIDKIREQAKRNHRTIGAELQLIVERGLEPEPPPKRR